MSTVAVQRPLGHAMRDFPTTIGFKVQGGFDIRSMPTESSSPSTLLPVCASGLDLGPRHELHGVPTPGAEQLTVVVPQQRFLSCSVPAKAACWPQELSSALSAGMPDSPGPVGYQGLLEYSNTSGCCGVLGTDIMADHLDELNRDCKIEVCCTAHSSPAVKRLVKSVIRGLRACQEPDKASDGMGGTYFFSNEGGAKVAILKPCDEECLAPNNPKGYVGRQLGDPGWKPTVRVGEAAMREVAAYLLDHDRWARVPTSVLVRARHPVFCYQASGSGDSEQAAAAGSVLPMKLGSLQEFVAHDCDTSEMGPGRFSVRDVHRIGILDVRLFNTDRHAGNMLVRPARTVDRSSTADMKSRMAADGQYELIPIDHGFCLPETLEAPYFEWQHWPQTMLPFSDEELAYIRDLDVEKDKAILRQELPMLRPECLRVLEVCTTLLKKCAEAGLTLYDIATVMSRPFVDGDEEPSELERMCAYARQCVEFTQEMLSECDGESECDEEQTQLHAGPRSPVRRGMTISSIREEAEGEDALLFELSDQEGEASPRGRRVAHGQLPERVYDSDESSPGASRSSSLSLSEGLALPMGSIASMGIAAADASSPAEAAGGELRQAPLASSVHVTGDGFLWRKMKMQQATRRAGKGCAKRSHMAPQAYPPPVAAFSPERMSRCFSGMDEEEWQQFMGVLVEQIDAALEKGSWSQQQADLSAGMALSCPRF